MTRWLTDSTASRRFPVYTRANAADVLPNPISPLGATLTWEQGILEGFRDGYVANYSQTIDELTFEGLNPVAGVFNGYYYNNATLPRIFGIRSGIGSDAIDAAFFGTRPDTPPHVPHPDDINEELSALIPTQVGWVLSATEFPELEETKRLTIAAREARPDLTTLSDADLVARARAMTPYISRAFKEHVLTTSNTAIPAGILAAMLPDLAVRLMTGAGDVDSAAPSDAMWELSRLPKDSAEYRIGLAAFLREFGSRGPAEWDLWSEVWETKPELAEALIDAMRPLPRRRCARRPPRGRRRRPRGGHRGARSPGSPVTTRRSGRSRLRRRPRCASTPGASARRRTACARSTSSVSRVRELGRRHVAAGRLTDPRQVCMLTDAELDAFVADPDSFAPVLVERERQWHHLWTLEPPFFVEGDKPIPEIEDLACEGGRATSRSRHPARCSPVIPDAPVSPADAPASCSRRTSPPTSNPATSSSPRTRTRRGRRCSCPPAASSSTSVRSTATR